MGLNNNERSFLYMNETEEKTVSRFTYNDNETILKLYK